MPIDTPIVIARLKRLRGGLFYSRKRTSAAKAGDHHEGITARLGAGPLQNETRFIVFSLTVKADSAIAFLVKLRGREAFFGRFECVMTLFFRPVGAQLVPSLFPRPTPWASFFRRFAAKSPPFCGRCLRFWVVEFFLLPES